MPQFESHFFTSLIFWEVVSFAILFWVLYKFAFPSILETLERGSARSRIHWSKPTDSARTPSGR